ncbi:MAG: hypothetical protein IKJ83_00405 [Ruminococcus sp.]|nr:hypothetical protein [Ruminococcus sp.]
MKKKISLPIVIAIVLLVSALVFTIAYRTAIKNMNEKLTDLNEKQQMFSNLAAVDDFVREKSFFEVDETNRSLKTIEGLVEAYEGRLLLLSSDEYKDSEYASAEYTKMTIADGNVIVVLTEDQYSALVTPTEASTEVPTETTEE